MNPSLSPSSLPHRLPTPNTRSYSQGRRGEREEEEEVFFFFKIFRRKIPKRREGRRKNVEGPAQRGGGRREKERVGGREEEGRQGTLGCRKMVNAAAAAAAAAACASCPARLEQKLKTACAFKGGGRRVNRSTMEGQRRGQNTVSGYTALSPLFQGGPPVRQSRLIDKQAIAVQHTRYTHTLHGEGTQVNSTYEEEADSSRFHPHPTDKKNVFLPPSLRSRAYLAALMRIILAIMTFLAACVARY